MRAETSVEKCALQSLNPSSMSSYHRLISSTNRTLEIHVHKYYLHWALKSVNITYIGLFGSLGESGSKAETLKCQTLNPRVCSFEPCWATGRQRSLNWEIDRKMETTTLLQTLNRGLSRDYTICAIPARPISIIPVINFGKPLTIPLILQVSYTSHSLSIPLHIPSTSPL